MEVAGDFPKRVSHIAIVLSTEQEANTKGSVGLHCKMWKKTITLL